MDIVSGILIAATLISAAKNLYELTFMVNDDPAKERNLKYRTNNFDRKNRTKHYFLTVEGSRVIEIQPID